MYILAIFRFSSWTCGRMTPIIQVIFRYLLMDYQINWGWARRQFQRVKEKPGCGMCHQSEGGIAKNSVTEMCSVFQPKLSEK